MKQQKEKLFKRIRNRAMAFLAILGLSIGGAEGTGLLPEYTVDAGVGRPYNHVLNDDDTVQNIRNRYIDYYDILAEEDNLKTFRQTIPGYQGVVDIAVPQGLCHIDDYTIITAYNGNEKYREQIDLLTNSSSERELLELLSYDNRAMLIVLNSITNEEEAIIKLPDDNHVGGITTDGENLYIAKSSEYEVSVIEYDNLKKCIENNETEIEYDKNFECANLPSYITYDDDTLWIGTWKNENIIDYQSTLCGYEIKEDKLEKVNEFIIPQYTNGACFIDKYNQKLLVLSISNGRYMDSFLAAYRVDQDRNEIEKIGQIVAPPLAENIDVVDGNINVLFESGSPVYSGISNKSTSYPIDGYMSINMDKMFAKVLQQKENEEQRKMKKTYVIDKYIKEDESDEKESDDDEKEK
jgi:hypothetical protein